jgi:hypothetical protein
MSQDSNKILPEYKAYNFIGQFIAHIIMIYQTLKLSSAE